MEPEKIRFNEKWSSLAASKLTWIKKANTIRKARYCRHLSHIRPHLSKEVNLVSKRIVHHPQSPPQRGATSMDQEICCCKSPSMTTWPINSPLLSLPLKETTDRRLRGSGANPATKRQCRPQMAPTRLRRPSLPMQEGSWLSMQGQFI